MPPDTLQSSPIVLHQVLSAIGTKPLAQLSLPIYVNETKSKVVLCSLNKYRNWHHSVQNKVKAYFNSLIISALPPPSTVPPQFLLLMQLYYKTTNSDPSNVSSLMEKFSLDALKSCGYIIDDNFKYHVGTLWFVPTQDKANPRCELSLIQF